MAKLTKIQWKKNGYISLKESRSLHRKNANQQMEFTEGESAAEVAARMAEEKAAEAKTAVKLAEQSKDVKEKKKENATIKCGVCGKNVDKEKAAANQYICYECGAYFRVKTKNRLRMVVDAKSFTPWFEQMEVSNPLAFEGYEEKLVVNKNELGISEAVTVGLAKINGLAAVVGVCDAKFFMGSMGHVVGERITRAFDKATEMKLPVILFCCSGGARMQEGIVSLMQMAKTAAACKRHSDAGLLYIPVLTDPTTGGVTASFAMLGDVILAEPGALIGFAGPRVIEQTIGQKLPKGFQRAEFLVEHGIIDGIVTRTRLKDTLTKILILHQKKERYNHFNTTDAMFRPSEIAMELAQKSEKREAWDKVKIARSMERPTMLDYVDEIFQNFTEFHGDRLMSDDQAIVGGIADLNGQPVTVIGVQKGNTTEECTRRNFGMPSPEGYRKALRLMRQADKFNRPIITFINTAGAYPGITAEERGQGEAIARNLYELSALKVPVLSIIIGEGGSGGALALAAGNEVWMLENSTYSILSPEGFSSILWKDKKRAKEAATVMKITAEDLKSLEIIEKIIPEFGNADENTLSTIASYMKQEMIQFLNTFSKMTGEEIKEQRMDRFLKF